MCPRRYPYCCLYNKKKTIRRRYEKNKNKNKNKKQTRRPSHLSHVEHEGSERLPLRGVHVSVGLVGDELVVHQRRSHALGPMSPAEHLQKLLLEVLRVLSRTRTRTRTRITTINNNNNNSVEDWTKEIWGVLNGNIEHRIKKKGVIA